MPEFDDLPFGDVTRAASDAAEEPDFAVLATRGVRRRNRRRTSHAGLAAVVLLGTLGAVQLAGNDPDSAPEPAPAPPKPLVFTRDDGTTFGVLAPRVSCKPVAGDPSSEMITVRTRDVAPGANGRRSQFGRLELAAPLAEVADGASYTWPPAASKLPVVTLYVTDYSRGIMTDIVSKGGRGTLVINSASCGKQPQISFTLDGTLASEAGDAFPGVQVTGGLAVTGEVDASPHATRIVDHPISRLVSLSVSESDPQHQAAVWRLCLEEACQSPEYAVVLTGDGFVHRKVLSTVYADDPLVSAVGRRFLVRTGLGPGVLVGTDGSARKVTMQTSPLPAATGPVVSIGSGLPVWATIDGEAGTAAEVPGTRNMQQVMRLGDGSLAGLTFDTPARTWTYARSVDGGEHWETRTLDVGDNALCTLVETDGTADVVLEGADGATLFPFVAVHRGRIAGGAKFERFPGPRDPTAYLSGSVVLPDGRLLAGIESWSDQTSGGGFTTAPGLFVSNGVDWSDLERVDVGAPYSDTERFQPEFLDIQVSDGGATIYLKAPSGDPVDAHRSDDGGLTWQAVPTR